MYQSVPSLTIPPATPGIRTFSLPGGRGFELEKFSTVLKESCRNFSICFKEIGVSLKTGVLVSISAKTVGVMSTVSLITYTILGHFVHFDKKDHFCSCKITIKTLSVLHGKVYR